MPAEQHSYHGGRKVASTLLALLSEIFLLLLAVLVQTGAAHSTYLSNFPNSDRVYRGGSIVYAFGHMNGASGGGARTPFGAAFAAAGYSWTAALCNADSDGDGFTNGQELGDPGCVWTPVSTPTRRTTISDPGFAADTPDTVPTPNPVATTTPTPSSGPIPTSSRVVAQTDAKVSADGLFNFAWILYAGPSGSAASGTLDVTFEFGVDKYAAIGLATNKMSGHILVATYTSSTVQGACSAWRGSEWGIDALRAVAVEVVASGTADGSAVFVTCRVAVLDMGWPVDGHRAIFATGRVRAQVPLQHDADGKKTGRVHLARGEVTVGLQTSRRIVAGAAYYAALLLWLLIGLALWRGDVLLTRNQRRVFHALTIAMHVILSAIYYYVSVLDNIDSGANAPFARACGTLAAFGLFWILYPVPKHFGASFLVGSSHDRAVPYHAAFALVGFCWVTAHFGSMSAAYLDTSSDVVKGTAPRYQHRPLFGFIAWLCMLIMILFAVFARRRAYSVFRVVHYLWILVIVFASLHYPAALIGLGIPLINLAVDFVLRLVSIVRLGGKVLTATAHPSAGVTHVVIQLKARAPLPGPCDFALFRFGPALVAHPFTVAWADADSRRVHLFVKSNGEGTMTGQLLEDAGSRKLRGCHVTMQGYYGSLQVSPSRVRAALLVAGGIGVTPMMSYLNAMMRADNADSEAPPPPSFAQTDNSNNNSKHPFRLLSRVALVWVVRTAGEAAPMMSFLQDEFNKWSNPIGRHIDISVFVTGAGTTETELQELQQHHQQHLRQQTNTSSQPHFCHLSKQPHRQGAGEAADGHHVTTAVAASATQLPPSSDCADSSSRVETMSEANASATSLPAAIATTKFVAFKWAVGRPDWSATVTHAWPDEDSPVGVYTCGPVGMMDAVSTAAQGRRGPTFVHQECFEL